MERIGANSARSPLSTGAAEVPGLRAGASVVIKAISPSQEGRWTVLVNGKRLSAAVSIPLVSGARYSARVDRLPDRPGWIFHILGRATEGRIEDFLRTSGFPGDPLAAAMLRALMSESLPLDPKNLAHLRAALAKREADTTRASLLARALAKGLDPEAAADALEGIWSPSDAGSGDGGGSGSNGGEEERGKPGQRDSRAPESDVSPKGTGEPSGRTPRTSEASPGWPAARWRNFPRPEGGEDGSDPLPGLLSFLAARSSEDTNPYQLFNALPAPRGRWIYVPYRFEREGVAFSGTLRILVSNGSNRSDVLAADIESENGKGERFSGSFALRREGKGYKLTLSAGNPDTQGILSRRSASLVKSLAARDCILEFDADGSLGGMPEDRALDFIPVDDHA